MNNTSSMMNDVDRSAVMKAAMIGGAAAFVVGLVGLVPFLSCCLIGIPAVISLVTGVLYDRFATENGKLLTVQSGAIGGAMSGIGPAVGSLILSIVGLILGPIIGGLIAGTQGDASSAAANLGAGMVGLCFSIVIGVGISVVLAGVGGAAYVAINNRNTGSTMPPPPAM
jgi:hypothetical protein